ncbi:MAG TPA: GTP cyclohydrolase II [Flavobacteriales bacterium]|nr:GTP cyclohydrolase II [Flavobacteriales bacterium]
MKLLVTSRLPSPWGNYSIGAFGRGGEEFPHVVLHRGVEQALESESPLAVRIHSECMTGDVFASHRCDCGEQLHNALDHFKRHGGMLIYLRQEGRGIGLVEKLKAYNLQDEGLDTYEANAAMGHGEDEREYTDAVEILSHYGVKAVRLLTNNPSKEQAVRNAGVNVVERLTLRGTETPDNAAYLRAKREITGHLF